VTHDICEVTGVQDRARDTIFSAFIRPNPKWSLTEIKEADIANRNNLSKILTKH